MLAALFSMGKPDSLKTDNGPGYTSSRFADFCTKLHIKHVTGIPYNPQGQGIVEKANQTIKCTINKIKRGEWYPPKGTPRNLLSHTLFI